MTAADLPRLGVWAALACLAPLLALPLQAEAAVPAGVEQRIRAAVPGDSDREELRRAVELMSDAGYPEDSVARLLELASDLQGAGIGVADLSSKVREGVAKKVDPARVMSVLGERASKLKDGRLLVLNLVSEGTVFPDQQMAFRVVADYLSRGISPQELRQKVLSRSLADFPALENVIR